MSRRPTRRRITVLRSRIRGLQPRISVPRTWQDTCPHQGPLWPLSGLVAAEPLSYAGIGKGSSQVCWGGSSLFARR